jgi:hypothetical protein
MEKGHDSEALHRLIRENLHASSGIPIRAWNIEIVCGTYRQETAFSVNEIVYP